MGKSFGGESNVGTKLLHAVAAKGFGDIRLCLGDAFGELVDPCREVVRNGVEKLLLQGVGSGAPLSFRGDSFLNRPGGLFTHITQRNQRHR